MDFKSVKLELKLIYLKISKRIGIQRSLAKSSWNPKFVEVPPGGRFLVFSPHPDDDAIGMGGTIMKMLEGGSEVRVVYLSMPMRDVSSRDERRQEALHSLEVMGVSDFILPDDEFPEHGLLRDLMVKEVEDYAPDLVFVPSPLENHDHHLASFTAYLEALRILGDVDTALYEVWGMIVPNMAVDITLQAERKAKAIAAYTSQVRVVDYVTMVNGLNQYRAVSAGGTGHAEVFLHLCRKDLLKLFED